MPASDTRPERRGGRLLTVLFWAGVGLAPLAALVLLLGRGEGSLRVAAVLTVLAIVLIGLSITLRRDGDSVRAEMEGAMLDEIEVLREDLRGDIATAARATHRQFSEKLQVLYESVEALRGQVDGQWSGGYERPEPQHAPAPHVQASHAAASHAAASHAAASHAAASHAAASHAAASHAQVPRATFHPESHRGTAGVPGHGMPGPAVAAAHVPPPPMSGGVVRHTETVQVTTRHTVVDPHADGPGRGTVYGGTVYGRAAAPEPPRREAHRAEEWAPEPREESWTEQRLRERLQHGIDATRRSRAADPADDPAIDEHWSGLRAGDRWAAVRADERGRELRLGERRAAMHSDESGTELRIEDRWAAMRRDEPRGRRRAEDRWDTDEQWSPPVSWGTEDRWADSVEDTGRWEERTQRALPSSSEEPAWSQEWTSPEWTRRTHQRDDDYARDRWR